MLDYERWYLCCKKLLELGFDLDNNTARDLLCAINELYKMEDLEFISEKL